MLALVVTFLVAVYLLGPDLISRWILGFAVPRKAVVQTRAEEFTRGVLWAAMPLALALAWARDQSAFRTRAHWSDVQTVFSGLYSVTIFEKSSAAWYASAGTVLGWNLAVLWRLYFLVVLFAVLLNLAIHYYGPLRRRLPFAWMKTLLATMVLPRVAEWHVLLSPMLLPSHGLQLYADVLTKSGTLYQGRVTDKALNADGSIQSLTLTEPKRFLRERYAADESTGSFKQKLDYWRDIPGNVFILLGSDIANLNLRYQATIRPGALTEALMRSLLQQRPPERQPKEKR